MRPVFYIILLIILAEAAANAQTPVKQSISISVSASLLNNGQVQLITIRNIKIVGCNEKHEKNYISPVKSPNAGFMVAHGNPRTQVQLTYKAKDVLKNINGKGTISITYQLSSSSKQVQRESLINTSGRIILNLGKDGYSYLWVGGFIDLDKAAPGDYKGEFTYEIIYI